MMKRWLIVFVIALTVISPAYAQVENILQDPGFEGANYILISRDPGDGSLYHVPAGWSGGVITGGSAPWINAHPTGFPHTAGFKRSGGRSFHMARGGATFTAWLYQQVPVQPGSTVQGGSWAYIENGSNGRVRAGIDPTGGANPASPTVIWSDWSGTRNSWTQVSASATAQGQVVTLFLYATQDTPANPNGVYWDEAFLNGLRGTAPAAVAAASAPTRPMVTATANIRVRRGPGIDQARIGAMNAGESYPLIATENGWNAIDFNGQTGYVSTLYTSVGQGAGAAAPAGGSALVTTGAVLGYIADYTLRMRAAPTTDSATVTMIPHTETVDAVARSADNNWLLVNYNGQSGWVASWIGRLQGDITRLPVR